tara:strand:+ start:633 stop:1652 length:1020 start_codon:yes stop_codon:yes gene_type:complete
MKILIIGAGSIGQRHLTNLLSIGFDQLYICDNNIKKLNELKIKFPKIKTFTDFNEAINSNFNIVFICTPPHIHTEILGKFVSADCHVFCEKPLAVNLKDLKNIGLMAKEKNLVIMVGYVYRFFDPVIKIKEIIKSNLLGEIYSGRGILSQYLPDWHPWEDYRDFFVSHKNKGGGSLLEESHAIDLMRWLLGDVETVSCYNKKFGSLEMDCENLSLINLKFSSGSLIAIQLDLLGRTARRQFELTCEKGTLIWDNEMELVRLYRSENKSWEEFKLVVSPNAYVKEIKHFIDCIKNKTEPLITLHDGIEVLKICLAGFKSSFERREVKINEINESTIINRK